MKSRICLRTTTTIVPMTATATVTTMSVIENIARTLYRIANIIRVSIHSRLISSRMKQHQSRHHRCRHLCCRRRHPCCRRRRHRRRNSFRHWKIPLALTSPTLMQCPVAMTTMTTAASFRPDVCRIQTLYPKFRNTCRLVWWSIADCLALARGVSAVIRKYVHSQLATRWSRAHMQHRQQNKKIKQHIICASFYSAVVSTQGFDPWNLGSNPSGSCNFFYSLCFFCTKKLKNKTNVSFYLWNKIWPCCCGLLQNASNAWSGNAGGIGGFLCMWCLSWKCEVIPVPAYVVCW